ncbi:hypothetical protein BUALT_Bualt16G0040700 [Buddleja alternifolia]|uniref:Protein TIFY n=1 Tax=Buddleja alternifolia TaxID=168488 RepID=A0AAV6WEB0_9LAMI|nr:hypothetical protein BUALT_Bualt16G0040700 [Buddleja alternifolia]
MSSFEIVDSGKFSGGRSNFSQTCNLLSQYLKENGSFGDLTLGLTTPKVEPKETMDLLPMIEKSGQNSGAGNLNMQLNNIPQLAAGVENLLKSEAETAPMTIFYGGQVMIFNDFPADKAKEIMKLASSKSNRHSAAVAPPRAAESATTAPQPPLGSDLPIARKNSLARFLEKRKDRITANAPYPASKAAAPPPKAARSDAWLGFSPQFPLQVERH